MKITICGSIKNADKLVEIYDQLKELGHEPMMHEKMFAIAKGELDEVPDGVEHWKVKKKNDYIRWWHDLIVSGDAVLIGNFDKGGIKNYVGGNALMEMAFGHVHDKKVYLFNPVPEDVSYADEIKAMVDVVLDGDLRKLSFIEKTCDHESVGMLVWKDDKLLLIERRKPPFAFAPPAGHCDGKEFDDIAKEELQEETGLIAKSLKLIAEGKKENSCRRIDGSWHYWKIYDCETSGEIERSQTETKQIRWASKEELVALAKRAEEYRAGKISETEWENNPGLEPVWCDWLKELTII